MLILCQQAKVLNLFRDLLSSENWMYSKKLQQHRNKTFGIVPDKFVSMQCLRIYRVPLIQSVRKHHWYCNPHQQHYVWAPQKSFSFFFTHVNDMLLLPTQYSQLLLKIWQKMKSLKSVTHVTFTLREKEGHQCVGLVWRTTTWKYFSISGLKNN